jgi:DNA polymerase-3 subunit delta
MSSSLFLFTGPNTYAIRQERQKWCQAFVLKHGEENFQMVDGSSLEFRQLLDEVGTMPFLAEKRLLVVQGLPRYSKEQIEQLAKEVHPASIIVFIEQSPDKRLASTKAFLSIATVKEFDELSDRDLRNWLQGFAKDQGKAIDLLSLEKLINIVGTNQEMLAQEMQKIILGVSGATIGKEDVERLAVPSGEQEVWTLTNLLAAGKSKEALEYAESLLLRGEDAYSLWNILLWMLKNLGAVFAAKQAGQVNPGTIASNFGVPFPSVRTLMPLAQKATPVQMFSLIDWAAETDVGLKSGVYRATQEAPEELKALIDQCIIRCTALAH